MKKIFFSRHLLLMLLSLAIVSGGCLHSGRFTDEKPDEGLPEGSIYPVPTDSLSLSPTDSILMSTTWKLIGVVDAKTGSVRELERSQNCTNCYTITFHKDGRAEGHAACNEFSCNFVENPHDLLTTECACMTKDEEFFYSLMRQVTSYGISSEQLFLFTNDKNSYLKFQKQPEVSISIYPVPTDSLSLSPTDSILLSTTWKLIGVVDVKTGSVHELEKPQNCTNCYTITFHKDGIAEGNGPCNEFLCSFVENPLSVGTTKRCCFTDDEQLFYRLIEQVNGYGIHSELLYLFTNVKTSYLKFQKQ